MEQVLSLLKTSRGIDLDPRLYPSIRDISLTNISSLDPLILILQSSQHEQEAQILSEVSALCTKPADYGGLGLTPESLLSVAQTREVVFLISAWLEAQNSADHCRPPLAPLTTRPAGRRGMTLTEKIFAMHDVQRRGFVAPGMMVSVSVDWVLASDASWSGMERTYRSLNSPGIFRNDRFWLALDHVVEPRMNHKPEVAKLIEQAEAARDMFKMTEYQGQNYTILHTEFYRQRAEPGMIAIGSDSHTCSSGALGLLSIGLGAADVTMALVTGEIWFRIPEIVEMRFVGQPPLGIGGKDVILYILQQLKRNTVAADRVVEYTGPGLKHLSCDARFAIANMTTEFGGITGIFVPDEVTDEYVSSRKSPRNKTNSLYFRPDPDASYAASHEIDLSLVKPFIARYPNPDDVVLVTDFAGTDLDGVFIGACTTTEEDILLGALVLEQGLKVGMRPISKGKRKVTPGSKPIIKKLEETGLAEVYRVAGFEIGIPGCSYCVGMSADKAGWAKGSFGHLASAATVAASSFNMKATDPTLLIRQVDMERWTQLRRLQPSKPITPDIAYVEPAGTTHEEATEDETQEPATSSASNSNIDARIVGKVQRLGNMIDTDALAPAEYIIHAHSNEAIGVHCLEYTNPGFRDRVKQGYNIVVAGESFGVGSSRMEAVMALLGTGVQCVIAESFAFIFSRNAPSLGLPVITISSPIFYELAKDGAEISVDLEGNRLQVDGEEFTFEFSSMERKLMELGGITQAFHKYGRELFQTMIRPSGAKVFHKPDTKGSLARSQDKSQLAW